MIRELLRKSGIIQAVRNYRLKKRINTEQSHEEQLVVDNISKDKFTPLTTTEKQQIDDLWKDLYLTSKVSYKEFEMFKYICGFDARFLTHHNYLPVIAHLLNDYQYTKTFEDKGLLGFLKHSHIRFPRCYVRRIVSDFYDNNMHQISLDEAIDICVTQEKIFIKPSHETSGGKGASLLNLRELSTEARKQLLKKELTDRDYDFVVQECIEQHPIMANFNPTSVNTFRITTLMLNGNFSVCSVVLRCGKEGSTVDNWGAGGLLVNVTLNGKVNSVAHDIHLNEYLNNGDCVFSECSIPQLPQILKDIEQCHREDFAICKFIGWDIAIDFDGNPIIIELNSSQPGVIGEQLISGPIFGNRTQEVINYCKSKKFSY